MKEREPIAAGSPVSTWQPLQARDSLLLPHSLIHSLTHYTLAPQHIRLWYGNSSGTGRPRRTHRRRRVLQIRLSPLAKEPSTKLVGLCVYTTKRSMFPLLCTEGKGSHGKENEEKTDDDGTQNSAIEKEERVGKGGLLVQESPLDQCEAAIPNGQLGIEGSFGSLFWQRGDDELRFGRLRCWTATARVRAMEARSGGHIAIVRGLEEMWTVETVCDDYCSERSRNNRKVLCIADNVVGRTAKRIAWWSFCGEGMREREPANRWERCGISRKETFCGGKREASTTMLRDSGADGALLRIRVDLYEVHAEKKLLQKMV